MNDPLRRGTIVVAVSENGIIGRDNQLPWKLRSDLQRFKRITMGHALIMGRKTFESIGRVLPGRQTIVLTRSSTFTHPEVRVVHSLDDAVAELPADIHPFIVGGSEIFAQAIDRVGRLVITWVLAEIDGDTSFVPWDPEEWQRLSSETIAASEFDQYATRFEVWERRR